MKLCLCWDWCMCSWERRCPCRAWPCCCRSWPSARSQVRPLPLLTQSSGHCARRRRWFCTFVDTHGICTKVPNNGCPKPRLFLKWWKMLLFLRKHFIMKWLVSQFFYCEDRYVFTTLESLFKSMTALEQPFKRPVQTLKRRKTATMQNTNNQCQM